jgi:hypothetical protein
VTQAGALESRILRRILGLGKTKEQEDGKKITRRNFVLFALQKILPA